MVGVDRRGVVDDVGRQRQQVDRLPAQRPLLVQAREQQKVLHQQAHALGLALDPAQHPRPRGLVRHGALAEQLGEAADRRQRGAQLVAGVGHEPAHAVLRRAGRGLGLALRAVGGLEAVDHAVEGGRQAADLRTRVGGRHAAAQVAGGDRLGRRLDLHERAQAAAYADPGQAARDADGDEAGEGLDEQQALHGVVDVQRHAHDQGAGGGDRGGEDAPLAPAVQGGDRERLALAPGRGGHVEHRQPRAGVVVDAVADVVLPVGGDDRGQLRARRGEAPAPRTAAVVARVDPPDLAGDLAQALAQLLVHPVEQVAAQHRGAGQAGHHDDERRGDEQQRQQLGAQRHPAQPAGRGGHARGARST